MIKMICLRHVQTECNKNSKPWSQILGPLSGHDSLINVLGPGF